MSLSPAEVQIVRLVAAGLTAREIGTELGRSEQTVKNTLRLIRRDLGVAETRQVPSAYMEATGESPWPNGKL